MYRPKERFPARRCRRTDAVEGRVLVRGPAIGEAASSRLTRRCSPSNSDVGKSFGSSLGRFAPTAPVIVSAASSELRSPPRSPRPRRRRAGSSPRSAPARPVRRPGAKASRNRRSIVSPRRPSRATPSIARSASRPTGAAERRIGGDDDHDRAAPSEQAGAGGDAVGPMRRADGRAVDGEPARRRGSPGRVRRRCATAARARPSRCRP